MGTCSSTSLRRSTSERAGALKFYLDPKIKEYASSPEASWCAAIRKTWAIAEGDGSLVLIRPDGMAMGDNACVSIGVARPSQDQKKKKKY
mmetsp:Transcript_38230/g.76923  ORF Transcript_38230/g.76923 Transcript_38230/m.76923 type:complete len:90 (-) Transcript_38230:2-271(-)